MGDKPSSQIYMKISKLKSIGLFTFILVMISCSKDCEPPLAVCNETPPTTEICQLYFERWFFNKDKNRCELIGYSGCSRLGFETEKECEECKCH
ncbi:BPTI/Kunitz domain-containing protein [Echinicola rosea]|uniref:BPTI/Kunitz domain-containing protein n=1 Tax=Echinicola rosea TaxID=1807691 RepID=UPI0010CA651D